MLNAEDIQSGRLYRGKRRRQNILGDYDDRVVIHVSHSRTQVQYDSRFIQNGRQYPMTSMDSFLRWVKEEVLKEARDATES